MAGQLAWAEVADFRPGIYARTGKALGNVAVPAPPGSAQLTNTYRCFALKSGGLAPLPRQVKTFSITPPEGPTVPSSGYWIIGTLAFGPETIGVGTQTQWSDNLFVAVAYRVATKQQRFRLYRLKMFASPFSYSTLKSINSAYIENPDFYEPCWFASSRATTGDPTLPGNPIIAATWATPGGISEKFVSTFPDPAAVNVEGMRDLSTTRWGLLTGHQGRLVLLEFSPYYFGAEPGGIATTEQISFTDPPNSVTLGTQQQVFVQEYPNGFAAWGSISAGELFLAKQQGGGLIVSGDIAYPAITRLPGVISGGGIQSRATASPIGLVYGSYHGGACLWRGADTSEIISPQLDPENFLPVGAAPGNVGGLGAEMAMEVFESWGQFVYCNNNLVFDTQGGGWWLAEDRAVVNIMHWGRGFTGQNMYGSPGSFTQADPIVCYAFDLDSPAKSFSWQGHPMVIGERNRLLTIRELVLIAQGVGTVTVYLTKLDGSIRTESFTLSNVTQPQRVRLRTEAKCYSIIPRIVSDGGVNPAPVIHRLGIGYEESVEATAT